MQTDQSELLQLIISKELHSLKEAENISYLSPTIGVPSHSLMGKLSSLYCRLTHHRAVVCDSDKHAEYMYRPSTDRSESYKALDNSSKVIDSEQEIDYFEKLVENSILRQCLGDVGVAYNEREPCCSTVEENLENMLQQMILRDLDSVGQAIQQQSGLEELAFNDEKVPKDRLSTINEEDFCQIVQDSGKLLDSSHKMRSPASLSHKQNELMEIITQTSRLIYDLQEFRDNKMTA
ncbi:BA75_03375T0 [Komagataella pastoris]|uniref:BA75_03375T0 n=1 Tax=Komagataella pastoris TaxID=4922 RepID=A0A1B2JEV7_PICPA|nr:BA75_03375T0 [Komagataella pastoris]